MTTNIKIIRFAIHSLHACTKTACIVWDDYRYQTRRSAYDFNNYQKDSEIQKAISADAKLDEFEG
jgi:hypothetical protein